MFHISGAVLTVSQKKGKGGDRGGRHAKGTPDTRRQARTAKCPSCSSKTPADARYCPSCGVALGDVPAPARRDPVTIALYSIIVAGIAVAVAGVVYTASQNDVAAPPRTAAVSDSPAARPGAAVDLSTMSPREAADRLFNRIMMAEEQGNMQEVRQFVPMALQAYDRVDNLDADGQYHIGLLHAAVDDFANVRKQVETLKLYTPDHLLALMLEHEVAEKSGDKDAAAQAAAAFAEAFATEIMAGRPEYEAHRKSIEAFRAGTASRATPDPTPVATAAAGPGAELFASKCAGCHGADAKGSGKGPPLVHWTYKPGYHADEDFYDAVKLGVVAHHWPYGDMPPIPGLSDDEIAEVVAYVRAAQAASGIK